MRRSNRLVAVVLGAVLAAEVVAGMPLNAAADPGDDARYAALGDSFASGEGGGHYDTSSTDPDGGCHRSGIGYPRLLANIARSDILPRLDFAACTGAVTADVVFPSSTHSAIPAQLDSVSSRTSVVTLTTGGDNLGFKVVLQNCVFPAEKSDLPPGTPILGSPGCRGRHEKAIKAGIQKLGRRVDTTATRLDDAPLEYVLRKISDKSDGNSAIYVTGYPHLFDVDGWSGLCDIGSALNGAVPVEIDHDGAVFLNEMTDLLNAKIKSTVKRAAATLDVHYVDVASAFASNGDGLCGQSDSLINEVRTIGTAVDPSSMHPSAAGQRVYADTVLASMTPAVEATKNVVVTRAGSDVQTRIKLDRPRDGEWVEDGSLPPGLSLGQDGWVRGTPERPASSTTSIQFSDHRTGLAGSTAIFYRVRSLLSASPDLLFGRAIAIRCTAGQICISLGEWNDSGRGRSATYAKGRWTGPYPSPPISDERQFACATARQLCYAVDNGGTLYSTTNGRSWREVTLPTSTEPNTVFQGVACGPTRCQAWSTRSGDTTSYLLLDTLWTTESSTSSHRIDSMDCPSDGSCVFVNRDGWVGEWNAGDGRWTEHRVPPPSEVTDYYDTYYTVTCRSTRDCIAGSAGSFIIRWDGIRWRMTKDGTPDIPTSIGCGPNSCLILTGRNELYTYADDGVGPQTEFPEQPDDDTGASVPRSVTCMTDDVSCLAVTYGGPVYAWNGSTWTAMPFPLELEALPAPAGD